MFTKIFKIGLVVLGCVFTSGAIAQTVTLPVYESFDNADPGRSYQASSPTIGLPGWRYESEGTGGRLSFRTDFETHAGSEFIASMDNPGGGGINRLVVSINASGLAVTSDQVLLAFDSFDHGDERDPEDIVEVRGSDADSWVEVYNLGTNGINGRWTKVRDIDLSAALANAGQQFSATTQVRFSQTDNFPINTDGTSIEDVSIELAASADSDSPDPEILIASMVNYQGRDITPGDSIEYKVSLVNPSDVGAQTATDVVFELPQFATETTLVAGSVITSQGTIVTGNTAGDTTIRVNLSDISDGTSATLYFRASTSFNGQFEFSNQGQVSATNVAQFLTEDPTRNSASADPTTVRFVVPTPLPVYESFDNAGPALTYRAAAGDSLPATFNPDGLPGWRYEVNNTAGRLTLRTDFKTHTGSEYIASMDNPGGESINRMIVSVDTNSLQSATDQVLLAFDWYDHGDEGDFVDNVEIRSASNEAWIKVYDFATNSNNGDWTQVRDIDLSAALATASPPQDFTDTLQVRFSQNDNFPINTDGISIEDVSIEVAASTDSDSPNPEILVASMVDYRDRDVTEGDSLEYKVSIRNPSDTTGDAASSVVFEMPQFGPETSLVPGSVITSQGTVTAGNGASDTTILVNLGDIGDGQSATLYFRAVTTFNGQLDFFNQGQITATNVTQFMTEDPTRTSGSVDATLARFSRVQRAVTNLAIDDTQPVIGDQPTVSATGSGSSAPIVYSSDTPAVCQIINTNTVELLSRGDCTLNANQVGDATYLDATKAMITFFVDNDTIPDSTDNCPNEANDDQADLDLDGIGDACDMENSASLSLSISATTLIEGGQLTAFVSRSSDTTETLLVNLQVGNSNLTIPTSVMIAAGQTRSADFNVTSTDDVSPDGNRTIALQATASLHANGSANITVIENDFDQDRDTVLDRNDNCPVTPNPDQADFEGDGFGDACDFDTDGDGMPDAYERENGLDPRNSLDRDADADGDGFTNLEEFEFGTDPTVPDTDNNGDGIPDIANQRRDSVIRALPGIINILLDD